MYCRTIVHDDEIKRQQTRNSQKRRTVSTHDYNKRRAPIFGSQNTQKFNQQSIYGNQNNHTPIDKLASTQTGTEIHTHIDSVIKLDQVTLGQTDRTTVSKLSITSMLDQRTQILNTTKTFQRVTVYLRPTQFHLSTTRDKNVVNTLSSFFPLNFWSLRDQMKEVTSNQVFIWLLSTFPPEIAKRSGLKVEFMLDTGAACPFIKYS